MGSGKLGTQLAPASDFSLSAHSGPAGENPRGFVNLRNVNFIGGMGADKGHVVCVEVRGKRAFTIAEFKGETSFPGLPLALIIVEDNGQPSDAMPDRGIAFGVTLEGLGVAPEDSCRVFFNQDIPLRPLESGNITVHDSTP